MDTQKATRRWQEATNRWRAGTDRWRDATNRWRDATNRVAREDLVLFINACFACTGQREFYSDGGGQTVAIDFLHRYILGNYRRLYCRTLAAGINHFNQIQIVVNLLATGRDTTNEDRREEGDLIRATLHALPPQRALRALVMLRQRGVNNRRSRAVIKEYLASRPDPVFDAVKYRSKVRALAVHAHLRLPDERRQFLFRDWQKRRFDTPLFEKFRQAHYSREAIYSLPYSVATGFAEHHGVQREVFLQRIAPKMTQTEKLRLQQTAKRTKKLSLDMELGRVPLTRLAIYVLSLTLEERAENRERLEDALDHSARRALRAAPQRLGRVAAVLDRSYSSYGSSDKRRRPLAVALAAGQLLRIAAREYREFWTTHTSDNLMVTPRGQSDLATPLLDAFDWGADLVLIISDGFENDPPRGAAEVMRVFRQKIDPQRSTSVVHLNPVFDAERYAPKAIGAHLPTVGLRDAEDLFTMLGFARFADGSAPLSELEEYLEGRVQRVLASYADALARREAAS